MDVGQASAPFGGFPHSKRRPVRRRDVGSPKFTGSSTHDLTGVFVKPSKGDHAFFVPCRSDRPKAPTAPTTEQTTKTEYKPNT